MSEIVTPCHQLQRKRQKQVHEYSHKEINDINLVIGDPSPKLTAKEKKSVMNSFDSSSQDLCIETNMKRILTHVLTIWNEDKSNAHSSKCSLTVAEIVVLKIYSIKLKYCS